MSLMNFIISYENKTHFHVQFGFSYGSITFCIKDFFKF